MYVCIYIYIYIRIPQKCPALHKSGRSCYLNFNLAVLPLALNKQTTGQVLCNLNDSRKLAVLPLMKVLEALARGPKMALCQTASNGFHSHGGYPQKCLVYKGKCNL